MVNKTYEKFIKLENAFRAYNINPDGTNQQVLKVAHDAYEQCGEKSRLELLGQVENFLSKESRLITELNKLNFL